MTESISGPVSTCKTTGKRRYLTRKAARRAAQRINAGPGSRLAAYSCDSCGLWHLGHLPGAVIRGRLTRSDIAQGGAA